MDLGACPDILKSLTSEKYLSLRCLRIDPVVVVVVGCQVVVIFVVVAMKMAWFF